MMSILAIIVRVPCALLNAAGVVNDDATPVLFDATGDPAAHETPPDGASSSSESSTGLTDLVVVGDGVVLADSLRALSLC